MGGGGGGDIPHKLHPVEVQHDPNESETGHTKSFNIAGRFVEERERLAGGFTDADRRWRKQWLKDQHLQPDEPIYDAFKFSTKECNIFRRIYRWPLDKLCPALTPILGPQGARFMRLSAGKFFMGFCGIFVFTYYAKYQTNTWLERGRWRIMKTRRAMIPGDEGWPYPQRAEYRRDYYDRGFKDSILGKKYDNRGVPLSDEGYIDYNYRESIYHPVTLS